MRSTAVATKAPQLFTVPPTDDEKYNYLRGPQHRWFFWAHLVSFVGIAVSLYGFARMEYWTLIFLLPLGMYAAETLVGLRTSTYRRRVTLPDHQFLVETYNPTTWPSVDVFLPTAGEAYVTLENTYKYVAELQWPGDLNVYVLDDLGRDEIRDLAGRWGFHYIARPGSEFKKAGNLQYAFERTNGDHIFILDADFVPRPDALLETVPYMDADQAVGILQSTQYYPSGKALGWLERNASATQEIFYRFIQTSRDAVGASICCGTSAVYRRAALAFMGGFPQIGHSEDVFTGFEMMKKGYRVMFVPINVTQGLCPAEIDPYISQQYRWCDGSLELLKMDDFHNNPAITGAQRLSFWSGFLYYFTTAMNVFFAPLPVLVMVYGFPQYVKPTNFLPLIGLLVLWLVMYPLLLNHRWRLETIRVQVIYGFTHAVAIYDMFFGKPADWVPSGAANRATPLAVRVKSIMLGYLTVTLGAVFVGIGYQLTLGGYSVREWWALLGFTAINCYIFLPVMWVCAKTLYVDWRDERRERSYYSIQPEAQIGSDVL